LTKLDPIRRADIADGVAIDRQRLRQSRAAQLEIDIDAVAIFGVRHGVFTPETMELAGLVTFDNWSQTAMPFELLSVTLLPAIVTVWTKVEMLSARALTKMLSL
jgi:hypothetical protein